MQFSVACVIIFLSTFIPKGAFAINPKFIGSPELPQAEASEADSEDENEMKKTRLTDLEAPEKVLS